VKETKSFVDEANVQPLALIVDLSGKVRQNEDALKEDIADQASSPGSTDTENETKSDGSKRKKARTTFTGKQIYEMERKFEVKKYLSSNERSEMARILNVTETQVCRVLHDCMRFLFLSSLNYTKVPNTANLDYGYVVHYAVHSRTRMCKRLLHSELL